MGGRSGLRRNPIRTTHSLNDAMQLITIMADYGNGPYAWLNENPEESNAPGGAIADMIGGWPSDWNVSKELDADFTDWILPFDRDSFHNPESFPWEEFHRRGIELTRRLKREVGPPFEFAT
jgi:hypothetical protein